MQKKINSAIKAIGITTIIIVAILIALIIINKFEYEKDIRAKFSTDKITLRYCNIYEEDNLSLECNDLEKIEVTNTNKINELLEILEEDDIYILNGSYLQVYFEEAIEIDFNNGNKILMQKELNDYGALNNTELIYLPIDFYYVIYNLLN